MIGAIEAWYEGRSETTRVRVLGMILAVPSSAVLLTAALLTPAAAGVGTHRQLGLAPCTMLSVTGWPCPMCGMTTTFTLLAHGRPIDALLNQPFGPVLFALTCAAAGMGWADLIAARGVTCRALRWVRPREARLAWGLMAGMLGGWLYKAALMHPEVWAWP